MCERTDPGARLVLAAGYYRRFGLSERSLGRTDERWMIDRVLDSVNRYVPYFAYSLGVMSAASIAAPSSARTTARSSVNGTSATTGTENRSARAIPSS